MIYMNEFQEAIIRFVHGKQLAHSNCWKMTAKVPQIQMNISVLKFLAFILVNGPNELDGSKISCNYVSIETAKKKCNDRQPIVSFRRRNVAY